MWGTEGNWFRIRCKDEGMGGRKKLELTWETTALLKMLDR